jgi:hypothetical protein
MKGLPLSLPTNQALSSLSFPTAVIGNLPDTVIPDIRYRASLLVSFRMDPRYQPAGMTEMICHSRQL